MAARRLVVDPAIGIADLQKCYLQLMQDIQSRDLLEYLKHPRNLNWNWKTAPHPEWMGKCAQLMKLLLGVAPNGILPSAKNKQALKRLNEDKKANFSRYSEEDWCDQVDQRARVLLAQFRSCKQKQDIYQCCMRKATAEEKAAIDDVLGCLQVDFDRHPSSGSSLDKASSFEAAEPGGSNCLAIVPFVASASLATEQDAQGVFKRILQKQCSSPAKFPMEKTVNVGASKESGAKVGNPFVVPADCSSSCVSEVGSPIRKKRKAAKPEGPKKGKATKPGGPFALDTEDEMIMATALSTEVAKPVQKKPAAQKKPATNKSTAPPPAKNKSKSSFRHRATSSAYHKAKNLAKSEGHSPDMCKKIARAKAAEIAAQIDAGLLQEQS